MKKFEIKTEHSEIRTDGKTAFTSSEIFDAYQKQTEFEPHTEATFSTLEDAQETFRKNYADYGKTEFFGWSIPFLAIDVAFIEENEYDENGDFESGGDIWAFSAAPYELPGNDEEDD